AGPAFGEAALGVLSQAGGALHGLRVSLRHFPYDWARPDDLVTLLGGTKLEPPLTICFSGGGLFVYGSGGEIVSNLKAWRGQSDVSAVAGSVTRADEPIQQLRKTTTPRTRPRGLPVFRSLIEASGWKIERVVERPFSDQVVLT